MNVIVSNTDIAFDEVMQYNSSVVTNETFCIYYLQYKIGRFKLLSEDFLSNFANFEHFETAVPRYKTGLNDLLNDTGVYLQNFSEYKECLAEIKNGKRHALVFRELIENATFVGKQSTVADLLAYAKYLTHEFETDQIIQAHSASNFTNENDHVCDFHEKYSAEIAQGSDEYLK